MQNCQAGLVEEIGVVARMGCVDEDLARARIHQNDRPCGGPKQLIRRFLQLQVQARADVHTWWGRTINQIVPGYQAEWVSLQAAQIIVERGLHACLAKKGMRITNKGSQRRIKVLSLIRTADSFGDIDRRTGAIQDPPAHDIPVRYRAPRIIRPAQKIGCPYYGPPAIRENGSNKP